MLVDPDDGGVDHLHIAVMGCSDRIHQAVPDASFAPAVEAVVNGGWRPIALRQVRPERTRAQHPEDAVENPPIIDPWHAPRLVRQVRLDRLPLPLRQFVAAHPKAPEKEVESHRAAQENPQWPIMGFRPSTRFLTRRSSSRAAIAERARAPIGY